MVAEASLPHGVELVLLVKEEEALPSTGRGPVAECQLLQLWEITVGASSAHRTVLDIARNF